LFEVVNDGEHRGVAAAGGGLEGDGREFAEAGFAVDAVPPFDADRRQLEIAFAFDAITDAVNALTAIEAAAAVVQIAHLRGLRVCTEPGHRGQGRGGQCQPRSAVSL